MYYSHSGDFATALRLMRQGATVAHLIGDRDREGWWLANIGLHLCQLGKYGEAIAAHEEGLAQADATGDRSSNLMQRWNLSYAYWASGEAVRARETGESVLRELQMEGGGSLLAIATCLGHLGLILEGLGDPATARAYLSEARQIYAEHATGGQRMEVQAVEARCALAIGRTDEARRLAVEVWEHLRDNGVAMIDYPSRVYTCVADVMAGLEPPEVSPRDALEAGHLVLLRNAEKISDPEWRRSFLENEVANVQLLERWSALTGLD
jgi:tetratricopeptide (TPR) repeat protein